MAARVHPRDLPLKGLTRAFPSLVPVLLQRPRAEYEVEKHKLISGAFRAEIADQPGQVFIHSDSPFATNVQAGTQESIIEGAAA